MLETNALDIVLKDIPVAMGVFDNEMNYLSCSNLWLKKLNLTEEEILGRNLYEVAPQIPDRIKEIHQECLSKAASVSKNVKSIDENEIWKINTWRYKDNTIGGLVVIAEDNTELKKNKLELLKSEESFSEAFENSNVGMALVDIDGKWLKVNDTICNSLGYTKKEMVNLTFQDITHPEDLMKDVVLLNELLAGERENYQIEKRYFHKNGDLVYVIISVTSVVSIDGKLSHFISQIMDITSRKVVENKLKSMLDLISGQNDSLTNFAHIVSHNLRSHSTNLSMLTGFLKEEEDEEEKIHLTKLLYDSSQSLSETIHHLNEVVNINTKVTEKLEPVNLLNGIQNVLKTVSIGLESNNIKCDLNVCKSHNVHAVPAYMDSIILNLFTNSIKYRSPDRHSFISVSSKEVGNKIIMHFTDNGLGIDLKKHGDKLFGMYKTFHQHDDAKGIGLFITKNQMDAMKAKIEVESDVNVGTTFTLHFDKKL